MSVFTTANPVAAGAIGSKDQFDAVFENTKALKQGDVAFDFFSGAQVASALTGTIDDWNTGTGVAVAWAGASALTVRGIIARLAGDLRIVRNDTTTLTITFNHQDATAQAANRLILKSAGTLVIPPGGSVGFYYDGTASRWRVIFVNCFAEGAWTPTIVSTGGGAPTYVAAGQVGFYHRRDGEVNARFYIHLATLGTLAGGTLSIGGLPYPNTSESSAYASMDIPYWAAMTSPIVHLGGFMAPSASAASLIHRDTANVAIAQTTLGDISGGLEIIGRIAYRSRP